MTSDYLPISCVRHEQLEFSVLRKTRLALEYRDARGQPLRAVVLPVDVRTRDGAEWLLFRDAGGIETEIRLDRILSFEVSG